jgi:chromosome segregation ATPase
MSEAHDIYCQIHQPFGSCTCGETTAELTRLRARAAELEAESNARRDMLLVKSGELQREWMRAENAEGRLSAAERERDELRRENERLRAALEFYADPYGRRDESGELIPVPDFYSELAFGAVAEKALGK